MLFLPLSDVYVRSFPYLFSYFNKTLLHKKLGVIKHHLWPQIEFLSSGGHKSQCHSVVSLCDPTDCTMHGILQARILRFASPWDLPNPGIFPTQGSNPGLPHCRQVLYHLSHQGSPRILEWAAYPFSMGSS